MSAHGECDLDHLLKLSTDPNKLEGSLLVNPLESVKGINAEALTAFLVGNNVRSQYIDAKAIDALIEEVIGAPLESHSMVVANGVPAINGQSAAYTLDPEIESRFDEINKRKEAINEGAIEQPPESDTDKSNGDQTVNYYDQMAFVVVNKGDVIATKANRIAGSDGTDIFGQNIPASEGKPNDGLLDNSIVLNADGRCIANINGVLRVKPDLMFISDELEIRGDVDFETGRIRFPGNVDVHGAVRDKFSVRAQGEVQIRGLVESADLESDKSITLSRGMAGKAKGTIKSKGDLTAGYLEGVKAEVGQNLIIKSEITNSDLTVGGQIYAEHAAVRGGHISASKGGSIGSIGSVQNVVTEIVIGSLPQVEEQIRTIDAFLEKLEKEINSVKSKLEVFVSAIAKPTASQIEEQMGMQFEVDELCLRGEQLRKAKDELLRIVLKNTSAKLQVYKAIFTKVTLYIPGYKVEFNQELMGESTIELGPTGHPSITYRGQTVDLKEHARVIPDDRVLRVVQDAGSLRVAA